jgi:hypothetical protein
MGAIQDQWRHAGCAFGLEGGQGKSPIDDKLTRMLDERAIARWILYDVLYLNGFSSRSDTPAVP